MRVDEMRRLTRTGSAAVAVAALVLTSCSQQDTGGSTGDGPEAAGAGGFETGSSIGVLLSGDDSGTLEQAINSAITEANFEPDIQTAASPEEQLQQLKTVMENPPEVLIIDPADPAQLSSGLEAAGELGLPVISYDTLITGTPNVGYYVAHDHAKAGELQAQALLDGLAADQGEGPYNVELFAGPADQPGSQAFFDGAMGVLQPKIDDGTISVPSTQQGFEQVAAQDATPEAVISRMETLLADTYASQELHGVLAATDEQAQAILAAVEKAGKDLPVVTGTGSEAEAVESIMNDQQYSTTYEDDQALAQQATAIVKALAQDDDPTPTDAETYDNGSKIVPAFLLEPEPVTRENASEVYADDPELSRLAK
jgi:putative multiple sugar transport system substrate-binding protein